MKIIALPAVAALLLPAAAWAQSGEPEGEEEKPEAPIIVIADPDKAERRVSVGSRLPRAAPFAGTNIATNVGTPGLVPGSGMSPHATVRTMQKRDCVSDDDKLSKLVICALAKGDALLAEGDLEGAVQFYRHVAYTEANSAHERHVASEKLYAAGEAADDAGLREEALLALVDGGELAPIEAQKARRSLVALALSQGDDTKAIRRLEDVLAHDPEDARSLATLALAHHRNRTGDPKAIMRSAIAAQEAKGRQAPASWRRFAEEG
ncbi:hypothetical protein K3162_10790 [Qipengyuania xiapuensis]|uniref:Tetratricopeptide repeat protein n=1 Tax=Qipengyuania xiapuensis TaxID=2867236 RepID=A0ABX8ZY53_9SPHN|nr:hypothetical protein [Qipengyuania xiapuensis]QZD92028.1 hypothetical protein K3162_10790 [Qipengyuania xiapuensis]